MDRNRQRMLILSLDTSSRAGSAALWRDGDIVEVRAGDPARTHAERLPAELCALLDHHGARLRDVDLFAVAAGPGSFTGLRVGIATMQGLAFAHGRQVLPVPTLDALAWLGCELGAVPFVAAWVDAQRSQVFSALYRGALRGEVETADDPAAEAPAATLDRWERRLRWTEVRFVGDGAIAYESLILSRAGPAVDIVRPMPPLAPVIARIAAVQAAQGRAMAPHAIRPVYVRRPDAELARDRRQTEGR